MRQAINGRPVFQEPLDDCLLMPICVNSSRLAVPSSHWLATNCGRASYYFPELARVIVKTEFAALTIGQDATFNATRAVCVTLES
jgi:hypothetical protein